LFVACLFVCLLVS